MKLNKLSFSISINGELKEVEKSFLIEAYRKLFAKMYGQDIFDAFVNVSKINSSELINNYDLNKEAKNYKEALKALETVQNNSNYELLLINYDNKLIGAARLKRLNEIEVCVPDIALDSVKKDIEREIWKSVVSFLEIYFVNKGYKKMYIEIPLQEGPLLNRADDLGFKEKPEDIKVDEDVYTYLLSKDLGSVYNDKFDISN